MNVERVIELGAMLGEGPVWTRDRLWFVDIKRHRVYRFDPEVGQLDEWTAPDQVGWVLPASDGTMVAGVKTGLHRFDPARGDFALLLDPEPEFPGNRLNDAATDVHGTLWFGTMDDAEAGVTGHLYRMAGGICTRTALPAVPITNGPACLPDGSALYHTDTLGKRIWRVAVNDDGSLALPVLHVEIEDGAGWPDGTVIDAEGCLWTGLFGGWGVRRYDPAGALMQHVALPVSNVTKIAFGGPDLGTAYVTTARKGLDAAALAAQPMAGDVFAFAPGVCGLPAPSILL